MSKKLLLIASVLLSGFAAHAQYNLGVSTGNYSGLNSAYLNPAALADGKYKLYVDIVGMNAGIDNNLGKLESLSKVIDFANDDNANVNSVFKFSNRENFSLLAPYAELRGPSVIYALNRKHTFAFTTRARVFNQFNNFNQTLYRTITDDKYLTSGSVALKAQNFNWTAQLWSEMGLSYSTILLEKGKSQLKLGVTLRYLAGMGYIGLKGNNMDINLRNDTLNATNTDIKYTSNILTTNNDVSKGLTTGNMFNSFFGNKAGSGLGADIGVVYDYIENTDAATYVMDGEKLVDNSVNRYLFRVSASVLDLGVINYTADNNYTLSVKGNGTMTGKGLSDNVKSYNDFKNYALQQGFSADTAKTATQLYMPTRIVLGVDYNAYKHIYVNATYIGNLANRNNFGNSYYDQITVTPRYETSLYTVGLPITYGFLSSSVKVGIGATLSGFYIGSDDVLGLVGGNQYGANIYIGGGIPIKHKRIKDTDGDHVSDRVDQCPTEPGTWKHFGCPERSEDRDE